MSELNFDANIHPNSVGPMNLDIRVHGPRYPSHNRLERCTSLESISSDEAIIADTLPLSELNYSLTTLRLTDQIDFEIDPILGHDLTFSALRHRHPAYLYPRFNPSYESSALLHGVPQGLHANPPPTGFRFRSETAGVASAQHNLDEISHPPSPPPTPPLGPRALARALNQSSAVRDPPYWLNRHSHDSPPPLTDSLTPPELAHFPPTRRHSPTIPDLDTSSDSDSLDLACHSPFPDDL